MIIYLIISIFSLICIFLYLKFRNYVPILMYHRIADIPGDRNALPPEKFRQQMNYLAQHGFTTVTMQMVYDFYHCGKKLPHKPVLLTFDDGYHDNLNIALPILKEHNMTAVVFPIVNWIGKENKWENFNKALTRTMDWPELQTWKKAGLEIASHTIDHPFLANCSTDRLAQELQTSKSILEQHFAQQIDFICYPYGNFNQQTIVHVKKAGYKAAFAIFDNVPLWNINVFALPRIPIPARQSMWEFKLKVSKIHMIFIAMRKLERNIKRFLRNK